MASVGNILIEVCVDSVESAISAVEGGADRLELCANLGAGGGTTPSLGLLKMVKQAVKDTPIMVMIRPRVGDFLYSDLELEVMLEDIRTLRDYGIRGFVVGILTRDGRVDIDRMRKIVDEILPLEVCFHRAFDMTKDAETALRDIMEIGGISRILTSGQETTVVQALSKMESLYNLSKSLTDHGVWGLTFLPGSGINAKTLPEILERLLPLGLREIHLSAGRWVANGMVFKRPNMGMGLGGESDWGIWRTQRDMVKDVRRVVDIKVEEHMRRKDAAK
ncbi:hypothetical protein AGABI1DRAFT_110635 [Agaricus bisporus var. burnettii JB137-S8]|uniref:Copper homeostasis protein cutC homolog n=1 Tax=Agaricus bisporus var. burnettii (strain JB137-S8 / ATCC MYA-4627 / FGSC 10392) TaxID=597362 RepID=K5Y746_AGABU|nr:hypothetical protein AGABI2DRAFT_189463 [Agaricus bisporus var. bisporus H97]XP_007325762.1 uncharacterized protein AGABI1DRAFT_110635 [Agaricus bisporus var. burnettii JB137-S8]EKM84040.1 hypothetical protein AGABI1DRAFT_110635 [Agaricus bisporus var. burnettii JB137-S8]EKV51182.1 hypothetical protein AGABI2DRAFT_189463 [Agaricus bisporus var. bisporus H97]